MSKTEVIMSNGQLYVLMEKHNRDLNELTATIEHLRNKCYLQQQIIANYVHKSFDCIFNVGNQINEFTSGLFSDIVGNAISDNTQMINTKMQKHQERIEKLKHPVDQQVKEELEKNIIYFNNNVNMWIAAGHHQQWVSIVDGVVVSFNDTMSSCYEYALTKHGINKTILVRQILSEYLV